MTKYISNKCGMKIQWAQVQNKEYLSTNSSKILAIASAQ